MAWTERYVRADAAGGGDGLTPDTAFTVAEAVARSADSQVPVVVVNLAGDE
jgi:hypothetical protein